MLLRGMHDGGCDEVYIIVTDLKRQEMDDVTEYFKLVTKYSVSRSRKNSTEQQIQYQRTSRWTCLFRVPLNVYSPRYAVKTYPRETAPPAVLPSNRLGSACDSLWKTPSVHRPFFAPDHVVFANFLYASRLRSWFRYIFRLPYRLPQSMLHRRVRNDQISKTRYQQGCYFTFGG